MLQTILVSAILVALGLTLFGVGFIFGWKGHSLWLEKTNISDSAQKEAETDSLYRDRSGKFYTHRIFTDED